MRTAGITTIVTDTRFRNTVAAVQDAVGHRLTIIEVDCAGLTGIDRGRAGVAGVAWANVLDAAPLRGPARVSGDNDADWIFSSGTTGGMGRVVKAVLRNTLNSATP